MKEDASCFFPENILYVTIKHDEMTKSILHFSDI